MIIKNFNLLALLGYILADYEITDELGIKAIIKHELKETTPSIPGPH